MFQEVYTNIVTTIYPLIAWLQTREGTIALLVVLGTVTVGKMKAANTSKKAWRTLPQIIGLSALMLLLIVSIE